MSHGDLRLIIAYTESTLKNASLISVRQYFMSNRFSQEAEVLIQHQ